MERAFPRAPAKCKRPGQALSGREHAIQDHERRSAAALRPVHDKKGSKRSLRAFSALLLTVTVNRQLSTVNCLSTINLPLIQLFASLAKALQQRLELLGVHRLRQVMIEARFVGAMFIFDLPPSR